MVKNGQFAAKGDDAEVPIPVPYRPPGGPPAVEHFTLESLRHRLGVRLDRLEQLEFALVIVGRAGAGFHEVDFQRHSVRPGTVVRVRPGQVHRWMPSGYQATVIVLPPGTSGASQWMTVERVGRGVLDQLDRLLALDAHASTTFPGDCLAARALVAELIERLLAPRGALAQSAYGQLLMRLSDPGHSRNVAAHSDALGYCPRTLTRACLAAEGLTAKQVIDRSVVLHAKRLLACLPDGVEVVARQLGFDDPSNFSRYFQHHSSVTPAAWRRQVRVTPR